MEPDKFRESRQEINRMCKTVNDLIDQKALEESREGYQKVHDQLDQLIPQAEGEIQERSVKNLGVKIKNLSNLISKLKPKSEPGARKASGGIVWDTERLSVLAPAFLVNVLHNMGKDSTASVSFGTSGKGIRPNYQIRFSDGSTTVFSGASHKPNAKGGAPRSLSEPFSRESLETAVPATADQAPGDPG